jgi:hypothetical protein
MSAIRLRKLLSLGPGIFGWMAIQVHANIVDRQLQITPNVDLVSNLSSPRVKNEKRVSSVGVLGGLVGRAKEQPSERHSKVKRIMLLERWYLWKYHQVVQV